MSAHFVHMTIRVAGAGDRAVPATPSGCPGSAVFSSTRTATAPMTTAASAATRRKSLKFLLGRPDARMGHSDGRGHLRLCTVAPTHEEPATRPDPALHG